MKNKAKAFAAIMSVVALATSMTATMPTASAKSTSGISSKLNNSVYETSGSDVFTLEGGNQEFILLDHDDEGFFVMTRKYMGAHNYDPDMTTLFDVNDENNIGYWLNHDFLENGNSYSDVDYKLPNQIKKHLVEREWLCEAEPEDVAVKGKIALLSVTEYKKYADIIGTNDDVDSSKGSPWNYWWLRSTTGLASETAMNVDLSAGTSALVMYASAAITNPGKVQNPYGVRPVFYLDNNFFLEEKVQLQTLGGNVADKLKKAYTKEQLTKVYGSQVKEIYKSYPPEAVNVAINGVAIEGRTLKASYIYKSSAGEPEGKTKYRWLRAKKSTGPYATIMGANKSEYTLRAADAGCYIKLEIVPASTKQAGKNARSAVLYDKVMKQTDPKVSDVYVDGRATVGETLIARYTYTDDEYDIEKGTIVTWQISDDGKRFKNLKSTTRKDYMTLHEGGVDDTGIRLDITPEMEGKYLRFAVTVKNDYGTGEKTYALPTEKITAVPVAEKPQIENVNGTIKITSSVGDKDIIVWEGDNEDGESVVRQKGGTEYKTDGTEKNIRVSVQPVAVSGVKGETKISDSLSLGAKGSSTGGTELSVNGQGIKLKVGNAKYANTLTVTLKTDGVEIGDVTSDGYIVTKVKCKDGIKLIFTRRNGTFPTGELAYLAVSGSGNVKVESAESAYKTSDGKFVTKSADITVEQ